MSLEVMKLSNDDDYINKGVTYMVIAVLSIATAMGLFVGIYSTLIGKTWPIIGFGYMVAVISAIGACIIWRIRGY